MLEAIVLGIVQGITEWLPVSSSGMIFVVDTNLFGNGNTLIDTLGFATFLHLGTFFSALIYFRKEIVSLVKALFDWKKASLENKRVLSFLIISTLISAAVGYALIKLILLIGDGVILTSARINLVVGVFLLITALLVFRNQKDDHGKRKSGNLNLKDGIFLGLMQGISAIPGISRSGTTIAGLLMRGIEKRDTLRLSFLMSLPVILGANIALNGHSFVLSIDHIIGLVFSFIFGILTIHALMKIADRLNLGYFILIFAALLILASFIPG